MFKIKQFCKPARFVLVSVLLLTCVLVLLVPKTRITVVRTVPSTIASSTSTAIPPASPTDPPTTGPPTTGPPTTTLTKTLIPHITLSPNITVTSPSKRMQWSSRNSRPKEYTEHVKYRTSWEPPIPFETSTVDDDLEQAGGSRTATDPKNLSLYVDPIPQPGCRVPDIKVDIDPSQQRSFGWLPVRRSNVCPGSAAAGVKEPFSSMTEEDGEQVTIRFTVTDRCGNSSKVKVWGYDEAPETFFRRSNNFDDLDRRDRKLKRYYDFSNYDSPPASVTFKAETSFAAGSSVTLVKGKLPPYVIAICNNIAELHVRSPVTRPSPPGKSRHPGRPFHNILHLMLDSTSVQIMQRMAPNVLGYLEKLNNNPQSPAEVFPLRRHHTVHCCSPGNQIPVFAGLMNGEGSPAVRAEPHGKAPRWAWNEARELGYRTAFFFDASSLQSSSRDYHTNPEVDTRVSSLFSGTLTQRDESKSPCIFNKHNPEVAMEGLEHFWFRRYPNEPKFAVFQIISTHEPWSQTIREVDVWLADFLKRMEERGAMNNTVLILWSDHGLVYGGYPGTTSGMLESRLPFLYITVPRYIVRETPRIASMLRANADRLTSHFDLYSFARRMMHYPSADIPEPNSGGIDPSYPSFTKGVQLRPPVDFAWNEVPANRTCEDANIPAWACTCFPWVVIRTETEASKLVVAKALEAHQNKIRHLGALCQPVALVGTPKIEMQRMISSGWIRTSSKDIAYMVRVRYFTPHGEFLVVFSYVEPGPHKLVRMSRLDKMAKRCDVPDPATAQMCVCR